MDNNLHNWTDLQFCNLHKNMTSFRPFNGMGKNHDGWVFKGERFNNLFISGAEPSK